MTTIRSIFFCFLLLSFGLCEAQYVKEKLPTKDSTITIPLLQVSYAYQVPGLDIANRYGNNSNIGGSFAVKTKSNWYYGIKANYLWGNDVKQDGILSNITTSDGSVIDNQGELISVRLEERGSSFFLVGGKLLNPFGKSQNSGLLTSIGLGVLQHKIAIKYDGNVPSLSDKHLKGYDRLSLGYAVNGFIGYMHLSQHKWLNFFGGIDLTYGSTNNLRKFNYDTNTAETQPTSNLFYGLRVGWILRLNRGKVDEFYYY